MNTKTETTNDNDKLIERLFSVGAHFGFAKSRRHPTVVPYLFGSKQGTDIVDLEKTCEQLEKAKEVLADAGKAGKTVLFVGTKEEISNIVKRHAEETLMPYITNRWIGGTLTNFSEIKKRLARLSELAEQDESGELERKYTKKERVLIGREFDKLTFNFGGIKDMDKTPQLLLVVDPRHNHIAVSEAIEMNIPVIAVTSTDADLDRISYPILVNDALQASVDLVLQELADALSEGKSAFVPPKQKEEKRGKEKKAD